MQFWLHRRRTLSAVSCGARAPSVVTYEKEQFTSADEHRLHGRAPSHRSFLTWHRSHARLFLPRLIAGRSVKFSTFEQVLKWRRRASLHYQRRRPFENGQATHFLAKFRKQNWHRNEIGLVSDHGQQDVRAMGRPGRHTTDFMPSEMIDVLKFFTARRTSVFWSRRSLLNMFVHSYRRSAVSVAWAFPECGISPSFNAALSTE